MVTYWILAAVVAFAAIWLVPQQRLRGRRLFTQIPYVKFEDGDDSYQRYFTESRTVLAAGYNGYIKREKPFSMYNSGNAESPMIFLPMQYLDEVRGARSNVMSLPKALDQRAGLDKIGGFLLSDHVVSVVRVAMTRALNQLTPEVNEKCAAAYKEFMPKCSDWVEVNAMQLVLRVWTRMISHVIVGAELSQSDAWLEEMHLFIPTCIKAVFSLRNGYSKYTHWLARYWNEDIIAIFKLRSRVGKLLEPLLQERIEAAMTRAQTSGYQRVDLHADAIQWFVEEYAKRGIKPTPDQVAQDILTLSLVSLASTTATTLGVIYDLIDRPDSLSEIKDELKQAFGNFEDKVSRQALSELVVLDSFAKESQRLNPINQISMHRLVLQDYTFKDGLRIPAGTDIGFANKQISKDPSNWGTESGEFDPHRFLRLRRSGDLSRAPMTSVTHDMLPWGTGAHACPGRFLAADGVKMMTMHLLFRYEFKYPEGVTSRPKNDDAHLTMGPAAKMPLLFREKATCGL
ncbi:cytochrome P450 [Xylariaceae sp. FL0255]|nr:cytochrome P450 [Xylariaceae sp. FL0255]